MTLLVVITVALAGLAVLAAIVVVTLGGGGELSTEHPDHPPLALPGRRAVGGTDAALLRLPLGLWGYHKQITDEALERFAYELTERDTRIAILEQELAEARQARDNGTRGLGAARPLALPPGGDAPGDTGHLARRADQAFGATSGDGDPAATRTDRTSGTFAGEESATPAGQAPAPVTREEPLPPSASTEPYAEPHADDRHHAGNDVEDEADDAGDVEDSRHGREDGGR